MKISGKQITKEIEDYFKLLSLRFSAGSLLGSQLNDLELGIVRDGTAVAGSLKHAILSDHYAIFRYCTRADIDTLWLRYWDKSSEHEEFYTDKDGNEKLYYTTKHQSIFDCSEKANCSPIAFKERIRNARSRVRRAIAEREQRRWLKRDTAQR